MGQPAHTRVRQVAQPAGMHASACVCTTAQGLSGSGPCLRSPCRPQLPSTDWALHPLAGPPVLKCPTLLAPALPTLRRQGAPGRKLSGTCPEGNLPLAKGTAGRHA